MKECVLIQTGNVGIGTTSPTEKLEISSNVANGGSQLSIVNTSQDATAAPTKRAEIIYRTTDTVGTIKDSAYIRVTPDNNNNTSGSSYAIWTRKGNVNPTESMRIDNIGRVGIGTDNPVYALDVVSTGDGLLSLKGGTKPVMRFMVGTSTVGTIQAQANTSLNVSAYGTSSLNLQTAGTAPRLTILTGGNVGIGTTSPNRLLTVSNSGANGLEIEPQATTTEILSYNRSTSAYTDLVLYAKDMILLPQSGGNVGIGTTGPTALLHLSGASPYIYIDDTSTTGTKTRLQLISGDVGTTQSGLFGFNNTAGTATLNVLTFNELGNVGIGTTSPSQKLHLQNGILLVDSNTPTATGIWMPDTNGNPSLRIVTDQSAANYSSIVNAWGNSSNTGVMVGSTRNDGFAFQVRSGVTLTDGFANDTGNSRMVVLGNGNVGIGTTSPRTKLEVGTNGSLGSVTNKVISTTFDGGYSLLNSLQYNVNAFIGTTFGTTDIFAQTSGEVLKNFYVGLVSDNSYFNGSRYSITQGGAERFTVYQGGNVGIGTASPAAKLHIDLANSATEQVGMLMNTVNNSNGAGLTLSFGFNSGSGTTPNGGAIAVLKNATGRTDFAFRNCLANGAATEKMRIQGDGNVGIGTTSPNTQLEIYNGNDQPATLRLSSTVSDGDAVAAIISFSNDAGGGGVQGRIENIATEDDASYYKFYTDDTSSSSMTLDESGNMTIAGTLTQGSDVRLKENIKPIESALDKVKQMQGVEFNKINSSTKEIGVVAQEIEKIIPELVLEDKEGIKSVAYSNITAVLIEAIKEQQKQIEELKQQLNK